MTCPLIATGLITPSQRLCDSIAMLTWCSYLSKVLPSRGMQCAFLRTAKLSNPHPSTAAVSRLLENSIIGIQPLPEVLPPPPLRGPASPLLASQQHQKIFRLVSRDAGFSRYMYTVQGVGSLLARCRGFPCPFAGSWSVRSWSFPRSGHAAHRPPSPLRNNHPQYRRNRHVLRCMHFV